MSFVSIHLFFQTNFPQILDSAISEKIIKDIIPTISQLRDKYTFLLPFFHNGEPVLSFDTRKSDEFFDYLSIK